MDITKYRDLFDKVNKDTHDSILAAQITVDLVKYTSELAKEFGIKEV